MKSTKNLYWVFNILFAFVMLGSAIPDILMVPTATEGFKEMHLPAYLLPFLGVAKTLGVIGILIPGYPRIKEWAYAGLIYDLIGATYSVAAVKTAGYWAPMLSFIAVGFCAYFFYHKRKNERAVVNAH